MVLKGDIIKEMTGIDMPTEGIPSKAIWNPSDSRSSSSSVTSNSSNSNSNSNNDSMEETGDPSNVVSSSTEAFEAALPSAGSMESNSSLRVAQGSQTPDDDDRMGAMLTSSINSAHGSDKNGKKAAKARRDEKKNNELFGSTTEQREKFIQSMSTRSEKELRIQLWDSFRLARVILGKPVKDKRKLSHKSILHAIRKVAEMKIQIIRMSQELDRYKEREKKQKAYKKAKKQIKDNAKSPEIASPKEGESAVDSSPSSPSLVSPSNAGTESVRPMHRVDSESDTSDFAGDKLREQAIEILQQESDLALSQIKEIDQQREKKKRRFEDTGKLLGSPPITPRSPDMGTLFLSPSESEDDASQFSYSGSETASEILYAFKGKQSPYAHTALSPIMDSDSLTYASERDEIRRVLQSVVNFESQHQNKQPEITTGESSDSATQIHQDVIALLTRLSRSPSNAAVMPSPQLSESGSKQSPAVMNDPRKFTFNEPELTNEDLLSPQTPVNEVENEEFVECQEQLAAAKLKEAESKEEHAHMLLQKEILQEDMAIAREMTTSDREKVQLQRLKGYKNELAGYVKQEEERAKQMEALDIELNDMATACVKLEDRESAFAKKHEQHLATLGDFQAVSKVHMEKFRSLMGAIDRGITEQSALVFGKNAHEDDLPPEEGDTVDSDSDSSQHIQRLEYLLTKQNMEVFRLKAQLKVAAQKKKKKKPKAVPTHIEI